MRPKIFEMRFMGRTTSFAHCINQRRIRGKQVDVFKWRRLIEDVVGFKLGDRTDRGHAGFSSLKRLRGID